jgi:hypothetical protein
MKHLLAPEDLSQLNRYKEMRGKLRDTLSQQVNGSQKCSIGLFRKEAEKLGIDLTANDYKMLWNAFRVHKRKQRDEAAKVLILVQNELKSDQGSDVYYQ